MVTRAGRRGVATGVVVGQRGNEAFVLTAQHVTPGPDEREVQFFHRETYPNPSLTLRGVEVVKRWEGPDLALLKVKLGPDKVTRVPLAPPGQRPKRFPFDAISVGCSGGDPPTCRVEEVTAKRAVRRGKDQLAFFWELATVPVQGRSGGPLVDGEGRVIGICAAAQNGRGYYTHLDEILVPLQSEDFQWLWRPDR